MTLIGHIVWIGCELLPLPFSFSGALAFLLAAILLVLYPGIGIKEAAAMETSDIHGFAPKQE
jgi:hypothetical protein